MIDEPRRPDPPPEGSYRLARNDDPFRAGDAGARQRRLHLSRRPFAARRFGDGGLLRRRHLRGLGLGRHLRLLDLHDPIPARDARRRLAAGAGRHHGGRLGDDRRHGVMAERRGARRLGGGRAASRDHARGLYRRPRPGAWQCARRAVAAARHPARRRAIRQARRGRAELRRADRHLRFGQRGAAAQPDVGADEGARRHDRGLARDGADRASSKARSISPRCAASSRRPVRSRRAPTSSRPNPSRCRASSPRSSRLPSRPPSAAPPPTCRSVSSRRWPTAIRPISPAARTPSWRRSAPRSRRSPRRSPTPPPKSSPSPRSPSAATCRCRPPTPCCATPPTSSRAGPAPSPSTFCPPCWSA